VTEARKNKASGEPNQQSQFERANTAQAEPPSHTIIIAIQQAIESVVGVVCPLTRNIQTIRSTSKNRKKKRVRRSTVERHKEDPAGSANESIRRTDLYQHPPLRCLR